MQTLKTILIKVALPIILAAIGSYATYMSHKATLQTEQNTKITIQNKEASEKTMEALMNQLNSLVIPQIQKELEELKYYLREANQDESALRERVAKIEGILQAITKRVRPRPRDIPEIKEKPEPMKIKDSKKIPMIDAEQVMKQQVLQ